MKNKSKSFYDSVDTNIVDAEPDIKDGIKPVAVWNLYKITVPKLNVYNDPNKNGTLFDMSEGEIVEANMSESINGFVKVRHSGFTGYADKKGLKKL